MSFFAQLEFLRFQITIFYNCSHSKSSVTMRARWSQVLCWNSLHNFEQITHTINHCNINHCCIAKRALLSYMYRWNGVHYFSNSNDFSRMQIIQVVSWSPAPSNIAKSAIQSRIYQQFVQIGQRPSRSRARIQEKSSMLTCCCRRNFLFNFVFRGSRLHRSCVRQLFMFDLCCDLLLSICWNYRIGLNWRIWFLRRLVRAFLRFMLVLLLCIDFPNPIIFPIVIWRWLRFGRSVLGRRFVGCGVRECYRLWGGSTFYSIHVGSSTQTNSAPPQVTATPMESYV